MKIHVTEIPFSHLYHGKMRKIYELFDDVYFSNLKNPFDLSQEDRKDKKLGKEATYGEITFESFVSLLQRLEIRDGDILWDLGCGDGKANILAAMLYPNLAASKGVEYLPKLVESAKEGAKLIQSRIKEIAPVEFFENDLFKENWQDADIVYINNAVFWAEMNQKLANDLVKLKKGASVVTNVAFESADHLTLVESLIARWSWGRHPCFIYKRN